MRARFILIALLCAASAHAQPLEPAEAPPANPTATDQARQHGERGLSAYEAGRWTEALRSFERAHQLVPAPTFLLFIARCQAKLGQLLQARDNYRRVRDTRLSPDAPQQFQDAVVQARTEVAALATRLSKIRVTAPGALRVEIDGELAAAGLKTGLERDPGRHEVVAHFPGGESRKEIVVLQEGANVVVNVARPDDRRLDAPPAKKTGSRIGAAPVAAFGVGAAGLIVGGIAGALAWEQARDVKDQCEGNVCPSRVKDDADEANGLALVSTIGFAVFAVGTATGVVLLAVKPSSTTGVQRFTLSGAF